MSAAKIKALVEQAMTDLKSQGKYDTECRSSIKISYGEVSGSVSGYEADSCTITFTLNSRFERPYFFVEHSRFGEWQGNINGSAKNRVGKADLVRSVEKIQYDINWNRMMNEQGDRLRFLALAQTEGREEEVASIRRSYGLV